MQQKGNEYKQGRKDSDLRLKHYSASSLFLFLSESLWQKL